MDFHAYNSGRRPVDVLRHNYPYYNLVAYPFSNPFKRQYFEPRMHIAFDWVYINGLDALDCFLTDNVIVERLGETIG